MALDYQAVLARNPDRPAQILTEALCVAGIQTNKTRFIAGNSARLEMALVIVSPAKPLIVSRLPIVKTLRQGQALKLLVSTKYI